MGKVEDTIVERLDKKIKGIILESEDELKLLEESLDLLSDFVFIRKNDGQIILKEKAFTLPVKTRILIVMLARFIGYKINEIYSNLKNKIIFQGIDDPSLEFKEIIQLSGTKKGTASGVLSNYLKSGIIKKISKAKYIVANFQLAILSLKKQLERR